MNQSDYNHLISQMDGIREEVERHTRFADAGQMEICIKVDDFAITYLHNRDAEEQKTDDILAEAAGKLLKKLKRRKEHEIGG